MTTSRRHLVLLIDPNDIFRAGCRTIFDDDPLFAVIGDVGSPDDLQTDVLGYPAELVVLDPERNGAPDVSVVQHVATLLPRASLLLMTSRTTAEFVSQATASGAKAVLSKPAVSGSVLLQVASLVAESGLAVMDSSLVARLMHPPDLEVQRPSPAGALTRRETEILALLTEGVSDEEAARRLGIARTTIHTHISSMLQKAGVTNRVQLGAYAATTGILHGFSAGQDMERSA